MGCVAPVMPLPSANWLAEVRLEVTAKTSACEEVTAAAPPVKWMAEPVAACEERWKLRISHQGRSQTSLIP